MIEKAKQPADRIRFKIFSGFHSNAVEEQVNQWIRAVEEKGFIPIIIQKETRTSVTRSGKVFITLSLFFTVRPFSGELQEVDMDVLV